MTEIIVSRKPLSNYQTYIIVQINKGIKKLTLRAFGKHISKAMILADWVRRHFPKYKLNKITEDRSERGYIGIQVILEAKS